MAPTSQVSVLNHGQIISRKNQGIETIRSTSWLPPEQGDWRKDWQLGLCWHSVVSFTLSLLISFEQCFAAKNVWKFQRLRALQQGQTHAQSQTWCWALRITTHWHEAICQPLTGSGTLTPKGPVGIPSVQINFSEDNTVKHHIEPSLHHGPTHFKNLFLGSEKVKKVLLIRFCPFSCTYLQFAFLL